MFLQNIVDTKTVKLVLSDNKSKRTIFKYDTDHMEAVIKTTVEDSISTQMNSVPRNTASDKIKGTTPAER